MLNFYILEAQKSRFMAGSKTRDHTFHTFSLPASSWRESGLLFKKIAKTTLKNAFSAQISNKTYVKKYGTNPAFSS